MGDHETETGWTPTFGGAGIASASCSCGWAKVYPHARPTGQTVAMRLAKIQAGRHQAGEEVE